MSNNTHLLISWLFPKSENLAFMPVNFKTVEPDVKMSFTQWMKHIHRQARKIEIDAELLVNRRINDGERISVFTDCQKML